MTEQIRMEKYQLQTNGVVGQWKYDVRLVEHGVKILVLQGVSY